MSSPLPPDLSRLGDELVSAARREAARRARAARRRRMALAAVAGALAFAALSPAAPEPAPRDLTTLADAVVLAPLGCDQPRGRNPSPATCHAGMVLHRPYAWR